MASGIFRSVLPPFVPLASLSLHQSARRPARCSAAASAHQPPIGQPDAGREAPPRWSYIVYDNAGGVSSLERVVKSALQSDVVLIGETHDDEAAHSIELQLLREVVSDCASRQRPVCLGLEFLSRDLQCDLDSYMNGYLTEEEFIKDNDATLPINYSDYQPLISFARSHEVRVIGTNTPTEVARLVKKQGMASLHQHQQHPSTHATDEAWPFLGWLPPLGMILPASEAYIQKFVAHMGMHGAVGGADDSGGGILRTLARLLAVQNLWDATMAWSISQYGQHNRDALILHINGKFHCEEGLGIPEHLSRFASGPSTAPPPSLDNMHAQAQPGDASAPSAPPTPLPCSCAPPPCTHDGWNPRVLIVVISPHSDPAAWERLTDEERADLEREGGGQDEWRDGRRRNVEDYLIVTRMRDEEGGGGTAAASDAPAVSGTPPPAAVAAAVQHGENGKASKQQVRKDGDKGKRKKRRKESDGGEEGGGGEAAERSKISA
ncbi:unnamed protein product [Vitrella brassicaformis CCMP3155]|uniref:Haem-binding uptake Tiki superfamily ChaN domain-containing protein n=1 Tax=Vitrella brassicaformis (strain CCMP3155) TaxID=1169540 RepID=A0A0G4EAK3_VITBC|nr:unnamed protein product [Vitrella brassicaformis CCMP3155]|eukprot:CEL92279.1 unnamed protein product [Vitrella brassicaformis CCMP3155]